MQQAISRRRFIFITVAYFAALALFLFGDALFDSGAIISGPVSDIEMYFFPVRLFAFGEMRAGHLPLWNPYVLGGIPVLGNFQYAVLYPPNWLHLILPPFLAINLVVILHAAMAGIFTATWCRMRGASVIASLLGGTIFVLGAPYAMRIWAGHLAMQCVTAWMPLLFCCADAIVEKRSAMAGLLGGAAVVAMQVLAGYPQPVYSTALAIGVYVIVRAIKSWRTLAIVAAMYVLGAALSAAQLIPGIDAGSESVRAAFTSPGFAMSYSFPPENFVTLVAPDLFGDGISSPMFGRWATSETSLFMGVVGTTLVMIGIVRVRSRRDLAIIITLVAMLLLAMGKYTPLYHILMNILPGFGHFRVPARFAVLVALMAAALAAMGWDWLRTSKRLGIIASVTALCAFVTLLISIAITKSAFWGHVLTKLVQSGETLAGTRQLDMPGQVEYSAQLASTQLLLVAGLLAIVVMVLVISRRRPGWLGLLPVLVLCELWIGSPLLRLRGHPRTEPPSNWKSVIDTLGPDRRVLVMGKSISNLPIQFGVEGIGGYDPSVLLRWHNAVGPIIGAEPLGGNLEAFKVPRPNLAMMLRLGAILPPVQDLVTDPMLRLSLLSNCVVVSSPELALNAINKEDFDPRQTVVLEDWPNPAPQPAIAGQSPGSARAIRSSSDQMEITADLTRAAVLLITDGYASGWRVRAIESSPQLSYQVLPADYCMRGIPLSAGKHHFVLEYRPASVTIGLVISAISIAGWIIAWFTLLRRRRI